MAHGDDPVRHGLHVHQPLSPATGQGLFLEKDSVQVPDPDPYVLGLLDPLYGSCPPWSSRPPATQPCTRLGYIS